MSLYNPEKGGLPGIYPMVLPSGVGVEVDYGASADEFALVNPEDMPSIPVESKPVDTEPEQVVLPHYEPLVPFADTGRNANLLGSTCLTEWRASKVNS